MKRLNYFKVFEGKTKGENNLIKSLSEKQNDIPGSRTNSPIAVFEADKGTSSVNVASIPGYNFILVSDYRELWMLEGRECHLAGVGSPFGREDYVNYLNTLSEYAVATLAERMEHYGFKESPDSIMFGINGTVRVLDAQHEDMFYIAYPGEKVDFEMVTDINDTSLSDSFMKMVEKTVGRKMMSWLHKRFERQKLFQP